MKSNLLFSGYYGFDNSGDDAILQAIISELNKSNRQFNIKVLSYDPEKTRNIYDVESVDRFNLKNSIQAIKETNLLVSGGGSLLQDVTSTRSLIYYLGIILLSKFFGKKVYVYANGIGPIDKKLNRFLTKFVLNRVDLITLRDEDSADFLKELNIRNKHIEVTADPVYTLEPESESVVDDILRSEEIPVDKNYIGVAVRDWKRAPELKDKLAKALTDLIETGSYDVLFIPLHYPEDVEMAEEIKSMLPQGRGHIIKGKYSVKEVMGIVGKVDVILAMRLHALIYAVVMTTPIVGLIYDPKVASLLKTLEIEEYINVENFSKDTLVEKTKHVLANMNINRNKLQRKKAVLINKAKENVNKLFDLIDRE